MPLTSEEQKTKDLLNTKVSELGLTVRVRSGLKNANINVVGSLYGYGEKGLLSLRSIGQGAAEEVDQEVQKLGLPSLSSTNIIYYGADDLSEMRKGRVPNYAFQQIHKIRLLTEAGLLGEAANEEEQSQLFQDWIAAQIDARALKPDFLAAICQKPSVVQAQLSVVKAVRKEVLENLDRAFD